VKKKATTRKTRTKVADVKEEVHALSQEIGVLRAILEERTSEAERLERLLVAALVRPAAPAPPGMAIAYSPHPAVVPAPSTGGRTPLDLSVTWADSMKGAFEAVNGAPAPTPIDFARSVMRRFEAPSGVIDPSTDEIPDGVSWFSNGDPNHQQAE
jgi:hypothetical protein